MKHRQAAQVVNRRGNTPDSRYTAHTPPPRHVRIRRALNQQSAHALRKPEPGRHRQARSGDASGGLPVFRVTVTQSPAVAATPRVHLIFVSYKRQRVIGRAGNLSKIFSAKTTSGQTMAACAHAVTQQPLHEASPATLSCPERMGSESASGNIFVASGWGLGAPGYPGQDDHCIRRRETAPRIPPSWDTMHTITTSGQAGHWQRQPYPCVKPHVYGRSSSLMQMECE